MNRKLPLFAFLCFACPVAAMAGDFFSISSVKYLSKEPKDTVGVWRFELNDQKRNSPFEFQPCLEVRASTAENFRAEQLVARAYFFDDRGKILGSQPRPSEAGAKSKLRHFALPVLFSKDKPERLFFEIPKAAHDRKWKAVVVFGDKAGAVAACYPQGESHFLFDFPDKELVNLGSKAVTRKPAMDPLVEHVVKTKSEKHPKITLFLRPPKGVSDASEVRGVMAICALANSVESLKRDLQKEEMSGDYNGLFRFANENKLAILVWGSQQLWVSGKNYDELENDQAREADRAFDIVANAWERGVNELSEKYGVPKRGFLLWGISGGSHWAHRLCLRKPTFFTAVHIHVATTYDKPTPEAANVLWCVTTGELDPGYKRSLRFYAECRRQGYPITYKAIIGLGHAAHPASTSLGLEFFRFALQQRGDPGKVDPIKERLENSQKLPEATVKLFVEPPFWGDIVNQEVYPGEAADMVPNGFRTSLPTKEISRLWKVSR